ncbi:MAG: hypothetical protein DHS20C21_11400 [Gemmatimonadota bacterium]|nr:MAG: hypothetical protein DHS20C21_11400 [Gemmatimonadota bacterium]
MKAARHQKQDRGPRGHEHQEGGAGKGEQMGGFQQGDSRDEGSTKRKAAGEPTEPRKRTSNALPCRPDPACTRGTPSQPARRSALMRRAAPA